MRKPAEPLRTPYYTGTVSVFVGHTLYLLSGVGAFVSERINFDWSRFSITPPPPPALSEQSMFGLNACILGIFAVVIVITNNNSRRK